MGSKKRKIYQAYSNESNDYYLHGYNISIEPLVSKAVIYNDVKEDTKNV